MASPYAHLYPVILCGGSDTRLWPLSRKLAPRPLMAPHEGSESLLAAATRRCLELTDGPVRIVTCDELASEIAAHLLGQGVTSPERLDLLVEPCSRGTTFAIALAAAYLAQLDPAAIMYVVPSTHDIAEDDRYDIAISRAYRLALTDRIALIGTTPISETADHPLITPGKPITGIVGASSVARYIATPNASQVYRTFKSGGMWDTGTFMARASLIISELRSAGAAGETPESVSDLRCAETATFLAYLGKEHWGNVNASQLVAALPSAPFEQTVLEVSRRVGVVASSVEWSSVATLSELDELTAPTREGNRLSKRTVAINTKDTTVWTADARLVATLGVQDLMVVDTTDALLIADKRQLPHMPEVLEQLRDRKAPELVRPQIRPTPWGTVFTIRRESAFAVDRVQILPNHHTPPVRFDTRQFEMTLISGMGTVRLDTHTKRISAGDSFGVRPGVRIILTNASDNPMVLFVVVQDLSPDAAVKDAADSVKPARPQRKPLAHERAANSAQGRSRGTDAQDDDHTLPLFT